MNLNEKTNEDLGQLAKDNSTKISGEDFNEFVSMANMVKYTPDKHREIMKSYRDYLIKKLNNVFDATEIPDAGDNE